MLNKDYYCTSCPEKCLDKEDFISHCKSFHKLLVCDLCCKTYTTMAGLYMHKKMHSGEKGGCPKCTICGKHFQGLSYLKRHMKVHSAYRAYTCDQCGKAYKSEQNLKNHQYYSCQVGRSDRLV